MNLTDLKIDFWFLRFEVTEKHQQFSVWKKWGGHGTRNALKRGKGASIG